MQKLKIQREKGRRIGFICRLRAPHSQRSIASAGQFICSAYVRSGAHQQQSQIDEIYSLRFLDGFMGNLASWHGLGRSTHKTEHKIAIIFPFIYGLSASFCEIYFNLCTAQAPHSKNARANLWAANRQSAR